MKIRVKDAPDLNMAVFKYGKIYEVKQVGYITPTEDNPKGCRIFEYAHGLDPKVFNSTTFTILERGCAFLGGDGSQWEVLDDDGKLINFSAKGENNDS